MTNETTIVVSEDRSAQPERRAIEQKLVAVMTNWPNVDVAVVPHLYDLAPDGPGMCHLQSLGGDMIVLAWLYPRAAYWVLDANQVQGRIGRTSSLSEEELDTTTETTGEHSQGVPDRTIWCLDLRSHHEAGPLLGEIQRIVSESTGRPVPSVDPGRPAAAGGERGVEETTEYRWYPVIDHGRCVNCLECLNFCLFGVFGIGPSERLIVEQPDACRDGCPACSRVCPAHAIMFPHHNNPAIAGDPKASPDAFNLELVQLLGGVSPEQAAAAERDRALSKKAEADRAAEKDDLDHLVDDLDHMEL